MNTFRGLKLLLVFLLSFSLLDCTRHDENSSRSGGAQDRPNIVLIISDDQSWTDYGFMGHPHIETPNIDRLASESLTFTRGYLAAPLCRPSLATLATGLYPHRHGVTGNDPEFDSENPRYGERWMQERAKHNRPIARNLKQHPILPELLNKEGYRSFQTGKWWEGSWRDGGFSDGMTHGDPERGGRHGDEGLDIGREGMKPISDFIDKTAESGKPFFLWYAPFLPHTPHTPPDSLLQKYESRAPSEPVARYWAMCEWFDQTVGQLQEIIEQRGLIENTLFVYLADNGWIQDPDRKNRYLAGSKRSPYDMGIRTPVMLKWAGQIESKMDSSTFVSSTDIAPTILHAAGVAPPEAMPGLNLLNQRKRASREVIYSEDFAHDIVDIHTPGESLQHRVILQKPWKLIVPHDENIPEKKLELFNVMEDPAETKNLADQHPGIVNDLRTRLNQWWSPDP